MKQPLPALLLASLFVLSVAAPLGVPAGVPSLNTEASGKWTNGRSSACTSTLCLNEVLPNPNGYDDAAWPGGEWLELHNIGTTDIDMTGWKVTTSASKTLAFDANTIVGYQSGNASTWTASPGEFVVIARNGDANFYLTNTGMTVTLVDNNNNNVHSASWGSVSTGTSYEPDSTNPAANWVPTGSPTPGQANSAGGSTTLVPSDLTISEVMANPWPSEDNATWPGGEWIEILNTGSSDINLTGWSIEDTAGNVLPFNQSHLVGATSNPSSMLIAPGAHRIIAVNGTSPYGVLNNGVETLTLRWPNGTASQEIGWSSTQPGFALTVSLQANGLWGLAPYPTPGDTNLGTLDMMPRQLVEIQFTELLSNSSNDGMLFPEGEWVELHNTGNTSVDLMGWSIRDGMGNLTYLDPGSVVFNTSQGTTMIEPDGRRLVQFTAETQLWNNYNHLFLQDPAGLVVDTAHYTTDYGTNASLVRAADPTEAWSPAPWRTPGQPEPGTTPTNGNIRFSELLPDAKGADNQAWPMGEWIELHNVGTTDVDLTGWKLQAASRSLTLHEFNMPLQADPVVAAGDVVLIALNGTSSFYLKHTSPDSIGLIDAAGATVDTVSWSSTIEGESLIPPNSTHAGVGPNASGEVDDWIQSAWPTPGALNPVWPAYSGPTSLRLSEISPYCGDGSLTPSEDWVEVLNTGQNELNISRWSIVNGDGDRRFFRTDSLWNEQANATATTMLQPDERAVFLMDVWMISGLQDTIQLLHPDGQVVDTATWSTETDCQTLMPSSTDAEWTHTMWPTPGGPEPDPSQFAGPEDVMFTRFMPYANVASSGDIEFVEITNIGDRLAVLNGWTLRTVTGASNMYNSTVVDLQIQPGSSVLLGNDVTAFGLYEDGDAYEIDSVMQRSFYFPNGGAALQLLDGEETVADTLVYGNGPVDVSGWTGIALVEPVSNLANLIYLRGDGCGEAPDTDTVADWHQRWSRLGGSSHCYETTVTGSGTITPLIGPQQGLVDLLAWIEGAQSSLQVHLYQLQDIHLVQALIDAHTRGVEVTVVLDAGDDWWTTYDLDMQRGMATTLLSAGVEVIWFGDNGETPYAYIHSKIALRDQSSVWLGSGNWKRSSHPLPGESGNREWGILIDDASTATVVAQHLAFDEDTLKQHLTPVHPDDAPAGWSAPTPTSVVGTVGSSITGDFEAELLVCPDNCINQLVQALSTAEEEILLSLQYLDTDWSYGWGENPVMAALEAAAQRGVRLRLVINGAFLDEDIQLAVDTFNEHWNFTLGYDTAAIVMSTNDSVTKLHNKGAIIDGERVLISSINWGDSALVRNREMGLLVTQPQLAAVYSSSWWEDWHRLDNTTDSDQDGLLDMWETGVGLNRTMRSVVGVAEDESAMDPDGDGLTNAVEQLHGGNPFKADTDSDCIPDALEVAWAQSTSLDPDLDNVSPLKALTLVDADGNGQADGVEYGCDFAGAIDQPTGNTSTNTSTDDDVDGVSNERDRCPNTPPNTATDANGCSAQQRSSLVEDSPDNTSGESAQRMFLTLMVLALLLSAGAAVVLRNMRQDDPSKTALHESVFDDAVTVNQQHPWSQPVLDGTQGQTAPSSPTVTAEMLAKVPGWDEATVQLYLQQGWTMDQLATYYAEQVAQHTAEEQH